MKHYAMYNKIGAILCISWALDELVDRMVAEGDKIIVFDPASNVSDLTHFVDLSTMTLQPKATMSPAVSSLTVSNLPVPCTASIHGKTYQVKDGSIEIDADFPGPYEITLRAVGHLDCKVTVG